MGKKFITKGGKNGMEKGKHRPAGNGQGSRRQQQQQQPICTPHSSNKHNTKRLSVYILYTHTHERRKDGRREGESRWFLLSKN